MSRIRIPAANFTGHLMWTRSGVTWATWRLHGLPDGISTTEIKNMIRGEHQALFQDLRGEALLTGLCATSDPVAVVDKMLEGIDIRQTPSWGEECALTLDELSEVALGERVFFLSVPLAAGSWFARISSMLRAGLDVAREWVSIPRSRPSFEQIQTALASATAIEKIIPASFEPRRATVAEQVWAAIHSQHRGLSIDGPAPEGAAAQEIGEVPATRLPTAMPNPWLDEGGQSDFATSWRSWFRKFFPFTRRYLKVMSPHSEEPSYQVVQALVGAPKDGWSMNDVPFVSRVDQYPGLDVDWAIRFTVTPAAAVRRKLKRAEEQLQEQVEQNTSRLSITGGHTDLMEAAEAQAAYHASLNASDRETEVLATVIYAVGGRSAEEVQDYARYVASDFKANDFLLEAPLGAQEDLWWAMQPGTPMSRKVREHAQLTTGREFASGRPLVSSALGDGSGFRLGDNISTGRRTPVLIDLPAMIRGDMAATIAVIAELGSGKSTLLKCIAGAVLDRMGVIFALDRTVSREYAKFLRAIAAETNAFGAPRKKTVIADMLNPEWSLDPLRIWGPEKGARMVQSLFALMLNVNPMDRRGVALSALLEADYMAAHGITSLSKLLEHLERIAPDNPIADELHLVIRVIASKDLGRVLFDDALPALDLTADAIVITTAGLVLPDKAEVEEEHLFTYMPPETKFGRAMYAMLTQLGQEFCFMDTTRFALALFDEVHHITASREGERILETFFRDSRKHMAGVAVASHDPADIGSAVLQGLAKIRIVMRQTDEELARRAVKFIGLPVVDETVRMVQGLSPMGANRKVAPERRGEGIMRDARSRFGKIRVTLPLRPLRRESVLSTPSELAQEAA